MAQSKRKILKISKGQIAPNLIERSDIGILDSSAQDIVNFKNSKYGTLKTVSGSKIVHKFLRTSIKDEHFHPFGYKITLPDGNDGVLFFQPSLMTLMSSDGKQLAQSGANFATITNYKNFKIAQTSNLILIATSTTPIIQIIIEQSTSSGTSKYNISSKVFPIKAENVVKTASVKTPTINPKIFRFNTGSLPTNPKSYGIEIGDFVYLNSDETPPGGRKTLSRLDAYPAEWTEVDYVFSSSDTMRDVWSGKNWVYSSNKWTTVDVFTTDEQRNVEWYNLSKNGYNTIYGKDDIALYDIEVPAGYNAEKYVRSLVIGTKFDGLSTGGVVQIQDITVEIDKNNAQKVYVKKIHGSTLSEFDKAYTNADPAKSFRLTFSMVPAFAADYTGTENNITNSTNYPICVLFYQQRLIVAGTAYNGMQLVFSEVGLYDSFLDTGSVDGGFQLVIGSNEEETIQNVVVNQILQIFTDKAEWLLPDTTITQVSGFSRNSTIGSKGTIIPVIGSNGITLFVPKSGKGLCALMYNNVNANYNTPRISLFTDLLDVPIDNIGYKHAEDSTDDNYLYCTNVNGDVIIGNYIQEQQVQAFTRWRMDGRNIIQVICNGDDILAVVEKDTFCVLEYMTESRYTNGGQDIVSYNSSTGVITLPQSSVMDYNGTKLNVYDENHKFVGEYTVSNNTITLTGSKKPTAITEVGFNIHSRFESNPLNIGASTETLHKSVVQAQMLFSNESILDCVKLNNKKGWEQDKLLRIVRPVPPRKKAQVVLTNDAYPVELLSCEMLIDY